MRRGRLTGANADKAADENLKGLDGGLAGNPFRQDGDQGVQPPDQILNIASASGDTLPIFTLLPFRGVAMRVLASSNCRHGEAGFIVAIIWPLPPAPRTARPAASTGNVAPNPRLYA